MPGERPMVESRGDIFNAGDFQWVSSIKHEEWAAPKAQTASSDKTECRAI